MATKIVVPYSGFHGRYRHLKQQHTPHNLQHRERKEEHCSSSFLRSLFFHVVATVLLCLNFCTPAYAASFFEKPFPVEMNRAFANIHQIHVEDQTSQIDAARLRALAPELNKKILNTRTLSKQLDTVGKEKNASIRLQYEVGAGDGYDLRIYVSRPQSENDAGFSPTLHLKRLTVHTNGNLSTDDPKLVKVLASYENRNVTMDDLNTAVTNTTTHYRNNGFPAATAYLPPQQAQNNAIQIELEPGHYGKITIENNSRFHDDAIHGLTNRMKPGNVIRTKDIESVIYNIMNQGGVKAAGFLSPGEKQGDTDINVRIEDVKRDSYVLYAENHGSKSSGRYRYGLSANWYQMCGIGDHLSLYALLSNQQQHNWGIRYDLLVGHSGTRLGLGISRTDYELGSQLSEWGAVGDASILNLYGTTPLWRTSTGGMSINYGYTFQKLKDEMRIIDYSVEKHTHSGYIGIDGFHNVDKTTFSYDLAFHVGHLTGESAHIGAIPLSVGAEGTYTKGVLSASIVQKLNNDFDILLKLQAQQAGNNLDSSERFYLGGANGVRAYPQGEGSGDNGIFGTAEFRWHTKVPGLTLSTYFDAGHAKYTFNEDIPGTTTLKGWGIGLSYRKENDFFIRLDYARRIGLPHDATEDAHSRGRFWFMVGKVF